MKPVTALEDATFRYVLANAHETDGWLDLTRICSQTGRMLPDVRQAVARLARRGMLVVDDQASNTERWVKFVLPKTEAEAEPTPPTPAP